MDCPRCEDTLIKELIEGKMIDVCKSCRGMWLHKNQLDDLLKESGGNVEMCSIDENPHEDKFPIIKCRDCKNLKMKKINFLDYSDIILDYCPSCGAFWLDKNELANMHKYIHEVGTESSNVKNPIAYTLLVKLNEIAFAIFH